MKMLIQEEGLKYMAMLAKIYKCLEGKIKKNKFLYLRILTVEISAMDHKLYLIKIY